VSCDKTWGEASLHYTPVPGSTVRWNKDIPIKICREGSVDREHCNIVRNNNKGLSADEQPL